MPILVGLRRAVQEKAYYANLLERYPALNNLEMLCTAEEFPQGLSGAFFAGWYGDVLLYSAISATQVTAPRSGLDFELQFGTLSDGLPYPKVLQDRLDILQELLDEPGLFAS